MYYVGLDVHKRTISYCVKDASGHIHLEGTIPATRIDLDRWKKTLQQPWTEATCLRAPPKRVGRAFALLTRTYHGSPVLGMFD
jgi:hypothetical protein